MPHKKRWQPVGHASVLYYLVCYCDYSLRLQMECYFLNNNYICRKFKVLAKTNKNISPDFLSQENKKLIRSVGKSIRFNQKEIDLIERYCKIYKIESMSSFFRQSIIQTILKQLDEDYPKLF